MSERMSDEQFVKMRHDLAEQTDWTPGRGVVPAIEPVHGNCCCCQVCGQFHDDCVCQHNAVAAVMEELDRLRRLEAAVRDDGLARQVVRENFVSLGAEHKGRAYIYAYRAALDAAMKGESK